MGHWSSWLLTIKKEHYLQGGVLLVLEEGLSRSFYLLVSLVDAKCRYTMHNKVWRGAKGQGKFFIFKFFLSCHQNKNFISHSGHGLTYFTNNHTTWTNFLSFFIWFLLNKKSVFKRYCSFM